MIPRRSNAAAAVVILLLAGVVALSQADDGGVGSSPSAPNKLDDYVLTTQSECYKSKRLVSCFKYRISRYIWSFASGRMNWLLSEDKAYEGGNGLRLVRLNEPQEDDVFPEARQILRKLRGDAGIFTPKFKCSNVRTRTNVGWFPKINFYLCFS